MSKTFTTNRLRALLKGNNKREDRNVYHTYEYTRRKGNWKKTGGKTKKVTKKTRNTLIDNLVAGILRQERYRDTIKHTSGTPVPIHAVSHTKTLPHARYTGEITFHTKPAPGSMNVRAVHPRLTQVRHAIVRYTQTSLLSLHRTVLCAVLPPPTAHRMCSC